MRPLKVTEQDLLKGLMCVLQSKGYDGASLNELAASSGLQKASLYHRFPGGKKEIALTVLNYVGLWVEKNIHNVLTNQSLTPNKRLEIVLTNIDDLYESGNKTCILRALLMDSGIDLLGSKIGEIMDEWIDGFTILGNDFGFDNKRSKEVAIQVLIHVQGSLVVSKGLNNLAIFKSSLLSIKGLYIRN